MRCGLLVTRFALGEYPAIINAFPRNHFWTISWNLHFNDNSLAAPQEDPNFDKLHKVRPLIDTLTTKFLTLYNPHRENSIDEAVVVYKGQSSLKQFMPKKPIKRGFKIRLCDNENSPITIIQPSITIITIMPYILEVQQNYKYELRALQFRTK